MLTKWRKHSGIMAGTIALKAQVSIYPWKTLSAINFFVRSNDEVSIFPTKTQTEIFTTTHKTRTKQPTITLTIRPKGRRPSN